MNSIYIILIVYGVILTVLFAIAVISYSKLYTKYDNALDQLQYLKDNAEIDVKPLLFKFLVREEKQNRELYMMLFNILLDLINEEDTEVAIKRLTDLRSKAFGMNVSHSIYVKQADSMVNTKKDRSLNAIMYWLCSILDVRGGKDNLSVLARKEYNKSKDGIVLIQGQLIDLKNEIDIKEKSIKEDAFNEEDYEEDYQTYSEETDQEENQEWFEEEYDDEVEEPKLSFKNLFKLKY